MIQITFIQTVCIFLWCAECVSVVSSSCMATSHYENKQSGVEKIRKAKEKWDSNLVSNAQVFDDANNHTKFNAMGPVGPSCLSIESYGVGDSEKRVCGLQLFAANECIVISIGSNNEWGFEEAIFHSTKCTIHTLDCTMAENSQPPHAIQQRTHFHNICIGKTDEVVESRRYMSWKSILLLIGSPTTAPTLLKMDVEGSEWDVLPAIISGPQDIQPLQIAFELHFITSISSVSWFRHQPKNALDIGKFIDYLFRQGDYFVVDRHDNPFCPSCSELVINKICK
jgi:hypothetical protein